MKQVEEDLMDKMVVEADCIPGGIDGEVPACLLLQNHEGKTFLVLSSTCIRRQTESRFWTDARFRQKPVSGECSGHEKTAGSPGLRAADQVRGE